METHLLEEGTIIEFAHDPEWSTARFNLKIGKSAIATLNDISCNGLVDGSLEFESQGEGVWEVQLWNSEGSPIMPSDANQEVVNDNLSSGAYSFSISNQGMCGQIDAETIIEEPMPVIVDFTTIEPDCDATANGMLYAQGLGGTGQHTYLWSNGTVEHVLENIQSGEYSVTVTDENGCFTTDTQTVETALNIQAEFETGSEIYALEKGQATVGFHNLSIDAENYLWDFDDNSLNSNEASPQHTFTQAGIYNVSLTAMNGECSASQTHQIQVIEGTTSVEELSTGMTVSGLYDGNNIVLRIVGAQNNPVSVQAYSLLGKLIHEETINSLESAQVSFNSTSRFTLIRVTDLNTSKQHVIRVAY
ncbi:MAG: PKD domain-containing protein [Flavobacteriales bacterium]|nr:PKD domain-containing protein [Flavobacteriales bacterium]